MIWPPQDTGIFEFKLPCCSCDRCPGGFLIYQRDSGGVPFTSEALAQADLDDPNAVGACVTYVGGPFPADNLFATGGSTVAVFADRTDITATDIALNIGSSINLAAGSTLSVDYSVFISGATSSEVAANIVLMDCEGTVIDDQIFTQEGESIVGTVDFAIETTGEYWLLMIGFPITFTGSSPIALSVTFLADSDGAFSTNPIIAVWNSGGDDHFLACV